MLAPERLTSSWGPGPRSPALAAGEVHLWCAALDLPEGELGELAQLLDEPERVRASRFRFLRHRDRWTAGRAILRTVLSRYVGIPPADLAFATGPNGKPQLLDDTSRDRVHFNLAHADDVALIAVAADRAVGVDVERIQAMPDAELIAETHFAPGERDRLRRLEPSDVDAGFFRCWTRKEAFIKALGGGLSIPLDGFEVTMDADEPRLVHIGGDRAAAGEWSLLSCSPAPGFVGAVAVQSPTIALTCWRRE